MQSQEVQKYVVFFFYRVFKLVSFGAFLLSRMYHPCGTKPYRTKRWLYGDLPFSRFHKKMQKMLEGFFDLAFFWYFSSFWSPQFVRFDHRTEWVYVLWIFHIVKNLGASSCATAPLLAWCLSNVTALFVKICLPTLSAAACTQQRWPV